MRCRDGSVTTPTSSMQRPSTMSAVSHQHVHEHDCGHDHHHDEHTAGPIRADALLSGRGVSFARGGRTILEHIDIGIGAGEIVTLIGPNGGARQRWFACCSGWRNPTAA
jgi:ABC-type molybdenum transport system ATPase subunit/photorepair protein PhrA